MKVIEILNFNRELLKRLQAAGIRLEDARYIDLYADYTACWIRVKKFRMPWLYCPRSIR